LSTEETKSLSANPVPSPKVDVAKALFELGLVKSIGEGTRLIMQGAIDVDGVKLTERYIEPFSWPNGVIVKIGKRKFVRLVA
jgi:tyrosyl-tRNA synthetase